MAEPGKTESPTTTPEAGAKKTGTETQTDKSKSPEQPRRGFWKRIFGRNESTKKDPTIPEAVDRVAKGEAGKASETPPAASTSGTGKEAADTSAEKLKEGPPKTLTPDEYKRVIDEFNKNPKYGVWDNFTGKVPLQDVPTQKILNISGYKPGDKIIFHYEGKDREGTLMPDDKGEITIRDTEGLPWGIAAILHEGDGGSIKPHPDYEANRKTDAFKTAQAKAEQAAGAPAGQSRETATTSPTSPKKDGEPTATPPVATKIDAPAQSEEIVIEKVTPADGKKDQPTTQPPSPDAGQPAQPKPAESPTAGNPEQQPKPEETKIKELSDKLAVARDKFVDLARWRTSESDELKEQRNQARTEYNKCVAEYQLAETQIFKDKTTSDTSSNSGELLKEHILKLRVDEQLALTQTEVKLQEKRNEGKLSGKLLEKYTHLVEWYNKQNWKTKMALGLTIGIGGAALTATTAIPASIPLAGAIIFRGLTASASVFGFKRRAEAKAERNLEKENNAAVDTDIVEMMDKSQKVNWDNVNKYIQTQAQDADKKFDDTKNRRFKRSMGAIAKTAALAAAFRTAFIYGEHLMQTETGGKMVESALNMGKKALELNVAPYTYVGEALQGKGIGKTVVDKATEVARAIDPSDNDSSQGKAPDSTDAKTPASPTPETGAKGNAEHVVQKGETVSEILNKELKIRHPDWSQEKRLDFVWKTIDRIPHGFFKSGNADLIYPEEKLKIDEMLKAHDTEPPGQYHPRGGHISRHPDTYHGRGGLSAQELRERAITAKLNTPGGRTQLFYEGLSPAEQQAIGENASAKSTDMFLKSYEGSDLTDKQKQDFTNDTLYAKAENIANAEVSPDSPEGKFSSQFKAEIASNEHRFGHEGSPLKGEKATEYFKRIKIMEHQAEIKAKASLETASPKPNAPAGHTESPQPAAEDPADKLNREYAEKNGTQPKEASGPDSPTSYNQARDSGVLIDEKNRALDPRSGTLKEPQPAGRADTPEPKTGAAQPEADFAGKPKFAINALSDPEDQDRLAKASARMGAKATPGGNELYSEWRKRIG